MVSVRLALGSLLAHFLVFSSIVNASGLFEPRVHTYEKRLVSGTGCAAVNLRLLTNVVDSGICLCASGGALNTASLARVDAIVRARNNGVLGTVISGVGGILTAVGIVQQNALQDLLGTNAACPAPTNGTPSNLDPATGCSQCSFTCNSGYVLCGTEYCILEGAACISGKPARKRDLQSRSSRFVCPNNAEACLIPSLSGTKAKHLTGRNYECIETQTDLESCGGCTLPLPGRPTGEDCTAIPNAAAVACHQGTCVIESCAKGYTYNHDTRACEVGVSLGGHKGYWDAVKGASRVILDI